MSFSLHFVIGLSASRFNVLQYVQMSFSCLNPIINILLPAHSGMDASCTVVQAVSTVDPQCKFKSQVCLS